jgi:hypothetical protein
MRFSVRTVITVICESAISSADTSLVRFPGVTGFSKVHLLRERTRLDLCHIGNKDRELIPMSMCAACDGAT